MEQANTDFYILCERLKDYLGLLGAVKDAFHERTKLFQHWQHSQQMLVRKREAKEKLQLSNRTDKLEQAQQEVIEVGFFFKSVEQFIFFFFICSGRRRWNVAKRLSIRFLK